jgi:hypothetical protein
MLTIKRAVAATAGAIALVAGGLVSAAPAQADANGFTGYGNGTVGVTQNIVWSSSQDPTSCGLLTLTIDYSSPLQSYTVDASSVSGGNAYFYWTPKIAGTVSSMTMTSSAACSPISATNVPFRISKVNTTTTVTASNQAKVGQATQITALIQSSSPSAYQPTGTIVITDANGAPVSPTMGLTPGPGNGQSYAYFWWTPKTAGTYYFKAQYRGDANANQSPMSPTDAVTATPGGGNIALYAPPTMTQGQPVTLTATVYPPGTQGSVGFTVNGAPISASIPIGANGQASFLWTPNVVGQITLGASFTTNQGGSGSTSEQVTVNPGPVQKDVITLVQPGWGPWNNGGTYTLGNGSNFTFQASALSGAQVQIGETGPCSVSGLTITVNTGSGQCNMTAYSPGGNGYAAVQYGYTITLIPGNQTATIAAPQSGPVNKGRTLTLESPAQVDTNAGQNITWKITKGKNKVCKLKFPNSGAVKLKMLKKGTCNVKGTAPGVPGQWNPYTVTRSYKVK